MAATLNTLRADHARRGRTAHGALIITVAVGALTGTPADAAVLVTDTPIAAWRVDGVTTAVVVVGGRTYVGGTFTRATAPDGTSRPRANLAAFDTHTGELVNEFRAVPRRVLQHRPQCRPAACGGG